jgi:ADP-ribosylglycohydrolase
MIGSIIGDIVGSRFEFHNHRSTKFELFHEDSKFTDDTVCTIAVADWIIKSGEKGITSPARFASILQEWCKKNPYESYGASFIKWIDNLKPYNSYGNGAAMRISPVGDYFITKDDVIYYSDMATGVSHNHPEGIKGARAIAYAIWLARSGNTKAVIKQAIEESFNYDMNFTCDEIRETYKFNETCQGTVPQALVAFFESTDFESAIRLAVSIGGDSDTIACIVGGIAEAFYKDIPHDFIRETVIRLPEDMKSVLYEFYDIISVVHPQVYEGIYDKL